MNSVNEQLIHTFYSSFFKKDFRAMQECYSDTATFSDPVFRNLNAEQVRAMWEMFCVKSDSLKIEFSNIQASGDSGSAEWIATYPFSLTGRTLVNHIYAHFIFENGKILKHTDRFNFYKWTKQALGPIGIFLGWTPLIQNKIRKAGMKNLDAYMNKRKDRS